MPYLLPLTIVKRWWMLWISANFLGFFVSFLPLTDSVITTILYILPYILYIPLSIVAIKMIKNYAAIEPLLAETTEDDIFNIQEDAEKEIDTKS